MLVVPAGREENSKVIKTESLRAQFSSASHRIPAQRAQPLRSAGGDTLASTREKNPEAGSSQFERIAGI